MKQPTIFQRTPRSLVQQHRPRTNRFQHTDHPPLVVYARSKRATNGYIVIGNNKFRCALGRNGSRATKNEGDGATPIGRWQMLRVYYRSDRIQRPRCQLPIAVIRSNSAWCDAPADRNYNRAVTLPYPASTESLWRTDRVYDIIVQLNHNTKPRRMAAGSAIFIHVARPGFPPTEGCIALQLIDLQRLLALVRLRSQICIGV